MVSPQRCRPQINSPVSAIVLMTGWYDFLPRCVDYSLRTHSPAPHRRFLQSCPYQYESDEVRHCSLSTRDSASQKAPCATGFPCPAKTHVEKPPETTLYRYSFQSDHPLENRIIFDILNMSESFISYIQKVNHRKQIPWCRYGCLPFRCDAFVKKLFHAHLLHKTTRTEYPAKGRHLWSCKGVLGSYTDLFPGVPESILLFFQWACIVFFFTIRVILSSIGFIRKFTYKLLWSPGGFSLYFGYFMCIG